MNFWEAQQKARSRTTVYCILFILLTLLCAVGIEVGLRLSGIQLDPSLPVAGLLFIVITFVVALYNYGMYSLHGGSYVAESMGAYRVDEEIAEEYPQARQLLNIVEEISISSGLPMPDVFIIPADQINAFAAGTKSDNSAVAITEGALNKLSRDEIQGVIAHEFGHIYNGDMKISLRLAAMVMGFFFIFYLALRAIEFSGLYGDRRSRDSDRNGNIVLIVAVVFFIAGALMWLFGAVLKASVSRQREYLADACAIQFTRNPSGIASALRKIGGDHDSDMPKTGAAYSHLYFDDHTGFSSVFATHPPLKNRIEAIEAGKYMPEDWERNR